jgi:DNA-binding winged helix-turn-helix (wHTH) protein
MARSQPNSNYPECPCCGAPVDPLDAIFDKTLGVIMHGGESIRLTPTQFALVEAIAARYPGLATREYIMDYVYGLLPDCDEPDDKVIDVVLCKIRKALEAVGLVVVTEWGRGYRLVVADERMKARIVAQRGMSSAARAKLTDCDVRGTPEEETLRSLHKAGYPITTIAQRLGLPFRTTIANMERLGLIKPPPRAVA